MVDPKDYPRNKHAPWKRFLLVLLGRSPTKSTDTTDLFRGSSLPTSPTPLRRIECRWNLLPPEQPRVVTPYSQWRRLRDYDTSIARISKCRQLVSRVKPSASSKEHFFFEACLSHRAKPRHQPDIQRWETGGPGYSN